MRFADAHSADQWRQQVRWWAVGAKPVVKPRGAGHGRQPVVAAPQPYVVFSHAIDQ
ncbi:hypothetical protein [Micromonospora sonneratiae]|uniref:Uncharacterized protein n=1 Tax=Micromonospora sonneratiae TaxID=1184706 RepID=A0ABW3YPV3_9ACTN